MPTQRLASESSGRVSVDAIDGSGQPVGSSFRDRLIYRRSGQPGGVILTTSVGICNGSIP